MAGTAGSQRYGWSFARVAHRGLVDDLEPVPEPWLCASLHLAPGTLHPHPPGPPLVLVVALLAAWRASRGQRAPTAAAVSP